MSARQYELVYITPPETTEEAMVELHQLIVDVVEKFGGNIEKSENWGRRRMAYEIARHREGIYVLEVINGPGALTAELDRRLRVVDVVIRHMIVRVDEDLAAAERGRVRRKARMSERRIRRGLPPEPTESERKRREDDDDDDGGMDSMFRGGGDR
ncbi:MAG: 30S ribosomal protein S6 [Acidobacteriota bacterium]